MKPTNKKAFDAIEDAKTPEELLQAYRGRAEHMKQVLKTLKTSTYAGLWGKNL